MKRTLTVRRCSRRAGLKTAAAFGAAPLFAWADERQPPKRVAGIATVYFPHSHADVIFGKIMEGWKQDGGPGPALTLASMHIEQFPADDMSRAMSRRHGVPMFDTIEKALTLGGDRIAVDGVISIGEHGDYPFNALGQQLYPRRRFFAAIADAFVKHGRVVPVFNDKHLGPQWDDALWMHRRARELNIPLMAGSSMPVGFRTRPIKLPMNSTIEAAVGIGYDGLDIYGIHALEFFQWHLERRRDAETGVRWARFLQGPAMWQAVDDGVVSRPLLEAAFAVTPKLAPADMRQDKNAGLFLFQYVDGFMGAIFMLSCVAGTSVALKLAGRAEPLATAFDEREEPRHPHFAYLLKAIERMMHTGVPSYPVERTLLTSGILDRVLNSRARGGAKLMTPELAISYQPVDYPHAPTPMP